MNCAIKSGHGVKLFEIIERTRNIEVKLKILFPLLFPLHSGGWGGTKKCKEILQFIITALLFF